MPAEERRLVEEDGSFSKKTWLQKMPNRRAGELLFRALLS